MGMFRASGELPQGCAGLSQPGGGNRVAIGPGPRRWRTVRARGENGQVGLRQLAGPLQCGEPLPLVSAHGPRAGAVLDVGGRLGGS